MYLYSYGNLPAADFISEVHSVQQCAVLAEWFLFKNNIVTYKLIFKVTKFKKNYKYKFINT